MGYSQCLQPRKSPGALVTLESIMSPQWQRAHCQPPLLRQRRILLPDQPAKFVQARGAIGANAAFIEQILAAIWDQPDPDTFARMAFASSVADVRASRNIGVSPGNADKVRCACSSTKSRLTFPAS